MMKAMCQFLILVVLLHFGKQIDSASVDMKRSIIGGQDAAFLQSGLRLRSICDTHRDLSSRQREICRKDVALMGSTLEGAMLARKECKKQFQNEQWDCSTIPEDEALGQMPSRYATKEAAFNHALVAAGIVHVIARNCMKGDLSSCHCSAARRPQNLKAGYRWGGCGDNIHYASEFSRKFLDDPRVEKLNGSTDIKLAKKLLMDDHNNEAGRQAVLKNRRLVCKCHGATSQCPTQTCWYQVSEFHIIGDFLKSKYLSAIKAKLAKKKGKKVFLKGKNDNDLSNDKHKLVYIEDSPPYCSITSRSYYSTTIARRQCNPRTSGAGSCRHLCCRPGHNTQNITKEKECNCKFVWCCDVKCQKCRERVQVHTCR
ncbi:protein Wnt-5-like [Dendronephthya gigantea]|uniref:protein Wnt-5-like n=1 Tax=Dendronephthya gigantea TaxID=151771 RepID=UPI00106C1CF2|nr:protein Wnt-5-like [Dendronephthya gigantea]